MMTISTVAGRANVGTETVRYYERRGLIPSPPRTDSGYRNYPEETVSRIRFIRRAQQVGFTLSEIQTLLNLEATHGDVCVAVREQAIARRNDIRKKIMDLRRIDRALSKLIVACTRNETTGECPILHEFDH